MHACMDAYLVVKNYWWCDNNPLFSCFVCGEEHVVQLIDPVSCRAHVCFDVLILYTKRPAGICSLCDCLGVKPDQIRSIHPSPQ